MQNYWNLTLRAVVSQGRTVSLRPAWRNHRLQGIETSIFNVNGNSLPGPLIIGTLEKRAPGLFVKFKVGEKMTENTNL